MAPVMPRPSPDPALAAVLKRARDESGESQETVAHRAGITKTALQRIELGQSSPAWMTVCQIAAALDLSLHELVDAIERESS